MYGTADRGRLGPRGWRVAFLPIISLACWSGCSTPKHEPTLSELKAAELPYLNGVIEEQHEIQNRLFERCELEYERAVAAGKPNDRVLDVLILSGGGAKGAFGAGFLVGWGEVTDPAFARPLFDVVTGVSTGSLIAPMAFVGDAESYRLANETYRNPSPSWIRSRGLLDVLVDEDSFYTDEGLLRTICETIGVRVPAIAAQARDRRTLLVGAVNLNQGHTRAWDLTQLAGDVERGSLSSEEFCRRTLSSASIPLAFPPQLIDGNLYVDGSTTSDILITLDSFGAALSVPARWKLAHPEIPFPKIRLWVIANTSLFGPPVPVDSSDVSVLGRSLDLAVQAALLSQLKILELYQRLLTSVEGFDVEFRFVAMPDGWTQTGKGMFNKDDMITMSNLGMKMGRDPASWREHVPNVYVPVDLRDELMRNQK